MISPKTRKAIALKLYREDLEKQEGCGVVAPERLIEPRVKMGWLLAKPRSFSKLSAFLELEKALKKSLLYKFRNSSYGFNISQYPA